MNEAAWRQRFRAARVTLPAWAETAPQRTAYATNASGVWQVHSWDLASGRHTPLTDKPTGVRDAAVLPDGRAVVWFDDHDGDEVGRYVLTPFDGGEHTPLVPSLDEGWSAGLALRPERLAVGVSDENGCRLFTRRDDEQPRLVYQHPQPASVGGLSADGTLLAVSHTEHGDTLHPAIRVVAADSGETVAEAFDGAGNTTMPGQWSPVPGDDRLVLLADRSGRLRPEVWTPRTGQRVALHLDLPGEVWLADWWPDATALLLGHDHLARTELYRYDLHRHAAQHLPLGAGTVVTARVRDDGALWYGFTSSAAPSQVRVRAGEHDEVLLQPPGEPAPAGVAYRSLHYDNGDGGRVHAFLASPEHDGPHPLVVDAHGGPQAQTTDSFDPSVQAWVDHGFAVLMPNYRGSTGYGKAWEDALDGDPGRPELVDIRAGRDLLVAEGLVDPERVVLVGASWGGYLALLGIGTQPDAWSAAVAVVPVADYVTAFADESPVLQEFDRALFGGTPDERPELYRQRSPLTYVDDIRAPVLIVTGANDTRCPKRQVDIYVAALARRGVAYAYDVFDAGHGSLAVDETIRQQALAIDFVARHLDTRRVR